MLSLPFFCPPPKPEFLKNSGFGQNRTRALAVTDVHRYPLGQWADARRARARRYISTCQNYITDIRFWLIILVLRPQKNYTNCHNCRKYYDNLNIIIKSFLKNHLTADPFCFIGDKETIDTSVLSRYINLELSSYNSFYLFSISYSNIIID